MSSSLPSHSTTSNLWSKLEKFFLVLFLFFLPSQLGLHFWPSWSEVGNFKVDYLSPILYFTDLLFLPLVLLGYHRIRVNPSLPIFALIVSNLLVSISPWQTLYKWVRVLQLVCLTTYFINLSPEYRRIAKKVISLSLVWVSLIAIAQFGSKSSLGGIFYWLGERPLNMVMSEVAKVDLLGLWYGIRSYSTLPHPNALAGFLVLGGLVLADATKIRLISNLALLFTFSLSGWLAKALVTRSSIYKSITMISLLVVLVVKLPVIVNSVSLRLEGLTPIKKVTPQRLLVGYGLGNSIPALAELLDSNASYRLVLQPMHNTFLLLASEIGILPIVILFFHLKPKRLTPEARTILLVVVVTGLVDHYWITSHQSSLLLATLFGLYTLKSST